MAHRTWSFKLMASTVKNLTKDRTKNLTKSLIKNLIRLLPKNLIKNLTKNQTLEYQVHQDSKFYITVKKKKVKHLPAPIIVQIVWHCETKTG